MDPVRQLRWAVSALVAVVAVAVGTVGYVLLGFGALDALYQTVTTITTVGFREIEPLGPAGQVFTMVLILVGTGVALYTFTKLLEGIVDGHITEAGRRRRMDRDITKMSGHVIVCGWGRVGRAIAHDVHGAGLQIVVVDNDPERAATVPHPYVLGDATLDDILTSAGIARARALIAATDTDAENLYITLSGRALQPELFIVARARDEASDEKLRRAGADRVVNPQAIGGARIAAVVVQPNVADFLDVVMHDGSLEFRLSEVRVGGSSALVGTTLGDADIRARTGALVLAVRAADGHVEPNPAPTAPIRTGDVLIAVGTAPQLQSLQQVAVG